MNYQDEASKTILEISNLLKVENNKLDLETYNRLFKEYFEDNKPVDSEEIILSWKEIAGGYNNPVDIVDENGNIVKTIPGIYDYSKINMDLSNQINYNHILKEYEVQHKRDGYTGAVYLSTMLDKVSEVIINNTKDNKLEYKDKNDYKEKELYIDDDDIEY